MEGMVNSLIWGCVALGVVALITYGATSCTQQETDIRVACIKSGGMVLKRGDNNSDCLRGTLIPQN